MCKYFTTHRLRIPSPCDRGRQSYFLERLIAPPHNLVRRRLLSRVDLKDGTLADETRGQDHHVVHRRNTKNVVLGRLRRPPFRPGLLVEPYPSRFVKQDDEVPTGPDTLCS